MRAPPSELAPERWQALTGPKVVTTGISYTSNNTASPPANQANLGLADGVWLTRQARNCLHAAITRFDDAGYGCRALSDLYANAAELIADWSGRRRPTATRVEESETFIAAALDWRRQNRRSY